MKKTIPNVDGNYETKDGSLKVTVTRSTITIDVAPTQVTHIIDDDIPRGKTVSAKMDVISDVMNKTSKILMG
jgi:hypothetical protein